MTVVGLLVASWLVGGHLGVLFMLVHRVKLHYCEATLLPPIALV